MTEVFGQRTSAGISAWTSAGYPAPKLTLWAACSFMKNQGFGSEIWRVRQHTFAEPIKVRQESMTATWESARSMLSKFLAFREIILLNLFWGGSTMCPKIQSGNNSEMAFFCINICYNIKILSKTVFMGYACVVYMQGIDEAQWGPRLE